MILILTGVLLLNIGLNEMTTSIKKEQTNLSAALLGLTLDRQADAPLMQQLTDGLRDMILSGAGQAGARLPSSRLLADELGVSRATVVTALEQLIAEGYLAGRRGAGTFVAADLPHLATPAKTVITGAEEWPADTYAPFYPDVPDLEQFPYRRWAHHLDAAWRHPDANLLALPDGFGWLPLRQSIAEHLKAWRKLEVSPAQIVITSGAAESFDLLARLIGAGAKIHLEAPGYPRMLERFTRQGLYCAPLDVEADGLNPSLLDDDARAVVVTPSRHYPLGMTMPVARRLELLAWAERVGGLIIEDDYDSEFRYQGQPLPPLASLDSNKRTIYMGSFSKLLSPVLRLGFFVLPDGYVEEMRKIIAVTGTMASMTPQPALARFMDSGEFALHVRRMRRLYAKRHQMLFDLIATELSDFLKPVYQPNGMHIICYLKPGGIWRSDQAIAEAARLAGVYVRPISTMANADNCRQGLLMGFAGFDPDRFGPAIAQLKLALDAGPTKRS